jgi:hypothetical protein
LSAADDLKAAFEALHRRELEFMREHMPEAYKQYMLEHPEARRQRDLEDLVGWIDD